MRGETNMLHKPNAVEQNDFRHIKPSFEAIEKKVRLQITCQHCNGVETVALGNGRRTVSQDQAEKLFSNRHWRVGSSRRHDTCEDCLKSPKTKLTEELLNVFGPKPDNVVQISTPAPEPTQPAETASAAPPPQPTIRKEIASLHARIDELETMLLQQAAPDLTAILQRLDALERTLG